MRYLCSILALAVFSSTACASGPLSSGGGGGISGTVTPAQGGTGTTTAPSSGQVLVGTSGNVYAPATIAGTANRVTVTTGSGTITINGPQDLATSSSPQFSALGLGGAAGAAGTLTFFGSTSGSQAWKIPATGGTGTITFPAAHGNAGDVLTDAAGNGVLSWAAGGGGGGTTTGVTGWPNAVWSTGGTFSAAAPEIMFPLDQDAYIATPGAQAGATVNPALKIVTGAGNTGGGGKAGGVFSVTTGNGNATGAGGALSLTTGNGGTTHAAGGAFTITTGGGGGASGGVGDRGGDFLLNLGAGDAGTGSPRGGQAVIAANELNADALNDGDFQIRFVSTDNPYYVFNDTRFYTTGTQILGKGGSGWGGLFLDYVNTATIGAVTINTPTGTANLAASASSVVITNSLVTAKSHAFACLGANDATATSIKSVVCTLHTITITTNAAATGNTAVNFVVFGAD